MTEENNFILYPDSVQDYMGRKFFIAKEEDNKFLFIEYAADDDRIPGLFEGKNNYDEAKHIFRKKCHLTTNNRVTLQEIFPFTIPVTIGLQDSFGFGDRLGLAGPAHLRSLKNSRFRPVLAQQSIRELTRTNRTPSEVMDAAVWAVFQEGYKNGFGADADHLKTPEDIDLMVANGFRMFTFDPGDYVRNEADNLGMDQLSSEMKNINWQGLDISAGELMQRYINRKIIIDDTLCFDPDEETISRAVIKYGNAIAHIKKMFTHLKQKYPDYDSEVEISVDETESVTAPFEHYFIANEFKRLDISVISLAPRFIGDFEKGIDYKGDTGIFRTEYLKHLKIARYFGNYKISLHSGSDKFEVYKVIGAINEGCTHIKTAGTSYLEALKVIAIKNPSLFREILDYSASLYETEKKSYHVSADIKKVKSADTYSNSELIDLFTSTDVRQVLHVTYGRVLTDKNSSDEYIFKDRIFHWLQRSEVTHYELLINHFRKHLEPFEQNS